MNDDRELLDEFLLRRSQEAFADLVRRHVNLVYFTALRRVGGNRQMAEDVAQTVFIALAQKAKEARQRPSLPGWLFKSTRFAAAQAVRSEQRRARREQEAQALGLNRESVSWDQIDSLIDAAMDRLGEVDREMVLLRYYQSRQFAEIGAHYGLSADGARRRVERALDKVRRRLERRGFASAGAALATALGAQAAQTAPAHLAGQIAAAALSGGSWAGGSALAAAKHAAWGAAWKIGLGTCALVIAGLSFHAWRQGEKSRQIAPSPVLRPPESAAAPGGEPNPSPAAAEPLSPAPPAAAQPAKALALGNSRPGSTRSGHYLSAEKQLAALVNVVPTLSADQRKQALQIYQNLADVMDSLDPATRPETGEQSRRDAWRAVRALLTPGQRVLYDAHPGLVQGGESTGAERAVIRNAVFNSLSASALVRSLVGTVVRMSVRKMVIQWRRYSGESERRMVQGFTLVQVTGSQADAEFKASWTADPAGNIAVTEVELSESAGGP